MKEKKDNQYLTRARQILAAVEDKNYKARTVQGISKQVHISTEAVEKLLSADAMLKEKVMVVPGVKKGNQALYTTVDKYKTQAPLSVRIMNIVRKVGSK